MTMISGTLEYDPELRFTMSGKPLCTFTIRTRDDILVPCQAWENTAELIAEDETYFHRPASIRVSGYWKKRKWFNHNTREYQEVNEFTVLNVYDA
jgi:single-stranded DNA-binding protein